MRVSPTYPLTYPPAACLSSSKQLVPTDNTRVPSAGYDAGIVPARIRLALRLFFVLVSERWLASVHHFCCVFRWDNICLLSGMLMIGIPMFACPSARVCIIAGNSSLLCSCVLFRRHYTNSWVSSVCLARRIFLPISNFLEG